MPLHDFSYEKVSNCGRCSDHVNPYNKMMRED